MTSTLSGLQGRSVIKRQTVQPEQAANTLHQNQFVCLFVCSSKTLSYNMIIRKNKNKVEKTHVIHLFYGLLKETLSLTSHTWNERHLLCNTGIVGCNNNNKNKIK